MTKSPYKNWTLEEIEQVKNDEIPKGKNYAQCSYFCRAHLNKGFRPVKDKEVKTPNERGKRFKEMHEKGMTYNQIALEEGLTRQRVHALVNAYNKCIGKIG